MMNILIVSPDFLPNMGGISNMTHNVAKSLSKFGLSVYVMSPFDGGARVKSAPYHYIHDQGARPEIMSGYVWDIEESSRVSRKLEHVISEYKIDRVLSFHPHYYGQALMALKADYLRRGEIFPNVGSVYHGLELLTCLRWPKLKQALHERIFQRRTSHRKAVLNTVKRSDIIFCNSHYTQSLVKRINRQAPSHVIGCGVSQESVDAYSDISPQARSDRRVKAREFLNLPKKVKLIGSIGRLVPHKNIEALIRLISNSPDDVHALIAGRGGQYNVLVELAARLSITERIHFVSIPDEFSKWKALEALDQFVLLSKPTRIGGVEGFGIVMLEAMVVGVPVISSGTGGMRDVLIDGETGVYVNLRDTSQLEVLSRSLLSDPSRTDKLVRQAHDRVYETFLWSHVCHRIVKAWDNV